MARKQNDLPAMEGPGVAQPKIAAVEKAAEFYVKIRDKRMKMTEEEGAAYAVLAQAVEENIDKLGVNGDGILQYRYDDMLLERKPGKPKIRVRHADSDNEDED